jgi:hypothetical protein
VLRFEDESWAQVTDAEGRRLVFETGGKGSTKTIQGKPPFRVVLGRPSAVKVEYNGQLFDPMLREKKGIARFDLGAPRDQTGSQQTGSQETGSQQSSPRWAPAPSRSVVPRPCQCSPGGGRSAARGLCRCLYLLSRISLALMTKTVQAVRGMNDILPEETPYWQAVEDRLRGLFSAYGYQRYVADDRRPSFSCARSGRRSHRREVRQLF